MRGKPTRDTRICFTEVRIHHRVNPSLRWVLLLPKRDAFNPFPDSLDSFFPFGGEARPSQTVPQLTTPWELVGDA
jgi:hypothetical protein